MRLRGVFLILVERAFAQRQRIHKGPRLEMAVRIHEMKAHGRKIRAFAVLLDGIVRRKKTRADHNPMQDRESDEPSRKTAPRAHRAPLSVRIRGSAN